MTNAAEWETLKDLFEKALEREGAARQEFVHAACAGNPEMERQVRRLLAGYEQDDHFFSVPVISFSQEGEAQKPIFESGQVVSGRFRIVRFLARGGMGDVYEAEDQVLGERLALKVIRPSAVLGRELAHLKREIQSARRVTHANVCRSYDIAVHDDPPVTLLTMELLEGPTLSGYLNEHGAFSRRDALAIIEQIASGLQAAHDAGVIHRDFKPGNVILAGGSRGWRPVITDFGLALSPASGDEVSRVRGGTPGYMAPEQAEGGRVTPAADVYALGRVILRMCGAMQPAGSEASSAPPGAEPGAAENCTQLGPWRAVVERCLETDPNKRYQRPADVASALRRMQERRRGARIFTGSVLMLALCVLFWIAPKNYGGGPQPAGKVPSEAGAPGMAIRQIWTGAEVTLSLSSSPDGRLVAYQTQSFDVAIHDVVTGENRVLTHEAEKERADASGFVFSPDGKQVAYSWWKGAEKGLEIRALELADRQQRTLWNPDLAQLRALSYTSSRVDFIELCDWSPDGRYIAGYVIDGTNILLFPATGGAPRVLPVTRMPGIVLISPDSRYVVYDSLGEGNSADISIRTAAGGPEQVLVSHPAGDWPVGWDPSGENFLFLSDRTGSNGLWIVPYAEGRVSGTPRLIRDSLGKVYPLRITRNAAFHHLRDAGLQDVYIGQIDLSSGTVTSEAKPVAQGFIGNNGSPAFSPDGKSLSYVTDRGATGRLITVRNLESGVETQIRPNLIWFGPPRWHPDGRLLTMVGTNRTAGGMFGMNPSNGELALLFPTAELPLFNFSVPSWSPDGRLYYFRRPRRGISHFNLESRQEGSVYKIPEGAVVFPDDPVVSPDGKLVAFNTWKVFKEQRIMVIPSHGGPVRQLLTITEPDRLTNPGAYAWTPDSRYLLVAHGEFRYPKYHTDVWRIALDGSPPLKIGLAGEALRHLAVHPDGRQIAFQKGESDFELWSLENFLPSAPGRR